MALMYEQMLNMSRIIMCKGNAYQFSTDRPYKKMMSRYFVSTYHTRFRLVVTDRGDKGM